MVRIAEGIWPNQVKEGNFFARGEYRVDEMATETMKNSLMYKMSYYNFNKLFPAGQAVDRVRGSKLPAQGPVLNTLGVFSSFLSFALSLSVLYTCECHFLTDAGIIWGCLEEVFTSENWIVRIYKVKDLDNLGRDHVSAAAFETGKKKSKRSTTRKGPRTMRVV